MLFRSSFGFSGVPLQLVHLCRQIRAEAYSILLAENSFQFTMVNWYGRLGYSFLDAIGLDKARLIQNIAIRLPSGAEIDYHPPRSPKLRRGRVSRLARLVVFSGSQIRDEALQLWSCGIPIASIKFASSFMVNCPMEDLEQAQTAMDRKFKASMPKAHDSIPQLKQSELDRRTLNFAGLQLTIEDV